MTGPEKNEPLSTRFRFCTRCGSDIVRVELPQVHRCAACGFRHFINPIAAVAALMTDREGRLLLLRRSHDPGRGKLGLPGGFVDVGETAESALKREIREEVGLEVHGFKYFVSLPNDYFHQGMITPVLDVFFCATVEGFEEARAVSEVQELVVVAPAHVDLAQMAFASNAEALRRFRAG
jgi:ADP-ribose pyrophosphatase